jgi:sulfatase modifying factor 1
MNQELEQLLESYGENEGKNAQEYSTLARSLEGEGDLHNAATALDRAYGLSPADAAIEHSRRQLLDRLAVTEKGIAFRYIPAGTFLMGSDAGEPDEAPVHPVRLDAYWVSDTPLSWVAFCSLMGWSSPPEGMPPQEFADDPKSSGFVKRTISRALGRPEKAVPANREMMFRISAENRIRLQYCEDGTTRAIDWHAHAPEQQWTSGGQPVSSRKLFGEPPREDPSRPWGYAEKPMVSLSWYDAEALCDKLTSSALKYALPTEAEWEKAARGGLIDCPFPWGEQAPSSHNSDFDRFDQLSIQPMRRFAPNGYGLYDVSGGVWEWTSDWYDAQYYATSPTRNPTGPEKGQEKVIRGGSWADCAEVITVSFRMSHIVKDIRCGGSGTPNIGFRICRKLKGLGHGAPP